MFHQRLKTYKCDYKTILVWLLSGLLHFFGVIPIMNHYRGSLYSHFDTRTHIYIQIFKE